MTTTQRPITLSLLLLPALIALGGVAGLWLSWESLLHHTALSHNLPLAQSKYCTVSSTVNCDLVNKSGWSYLLGLPIASYGILYYLALCGAALLGVVPGCFARSRYTTALTAFTAAGLLFSLFLFAVSKFIIGALCPLCLATYTLNAGMFLLCWFSSRNTSAP
ncbi:MAG: hypothetical protein EBZ48_05485, partial [Proteobacteria bacterium]|nr:hypothetical protein [Pseudomonadota bacterium]